MTLSGTSMAAAVTSGVVAQLLEANRSTNVGPARAERGEGASCSTQRSSMRDDAGAKYNS